MPQIIKKDGVEVYLLRFGYTAPISVLDSLKAHVADRFDKVRSMQRFKLTDLCDPDYWEGLNSDYMRRLAGLCFRTLVEEGVFPVKFKQYLKYDTNYYVFID